MRQKSVPEKEPATQVIKNIRRAARRHSELCWKACAARRVSLSFVVARGSFRTSIIAGRRNFSRWGRSDFIVGDYKKNCISNGKMAQELPAGSGQYSHG